LLDLPISLGVVLLAHHCTVTVIIISHRCLVFACNNRTGHKIITDLGAQVEVQLKAAASLRGKIQVVTRTAAAADAPVDGGTMETKAITIMDLITDLIVGEDRGEGMDVDEGAVDEMVVAVGVVVAMEMLIISRCRHRCSKTAC
jgi:hypothetical protein